VPVAPGSEAREIKKGRKWDPSWRAPEEKKVPIGLPLPDITMDHFMDIEDGWARQEERV
jgi:hypothetical protein